MTETNETSNVQVVPTDEAMGLLPVGKHRPITVIGTNSIRAGFDAKCLQQAINSRLSRQKSVRSILRIFSRTPAASAESAGAVDSGVGWPFQRFFRSASFIGTPPS